MEFLISLPQRLDTGATPTFAGLLAGDGTAAAPSISFANSTNMGFFRSSANVTALSVGGVAQFFWGNYAMQGAGAGSYISLPTTGAISLVAAGTNQNITLTPSGTGWVQMGGTVDGQFRLYSSSNVEQMRFRVDGNPSFIATGSVLFGTGTDGSNGRIQLATHTTSAGGIGFGADTSFYRLQAGIINLDHIGGTAPGIQLLSSGVVAGALTINSTNFRIDSQGSTILRTNGTTTALTLDASQNATFVGQVLAGAGFLLGWSGRGHLIAPSDGVITLRNNAATDFLRLQFGGTTASFPSLKRLNASLQARLADDSGDAVLLANAHVSTGAAASAGAGTISYGGQTATTVGAAGGASALPATPTGYIIVNVAGTQMKVPYYAN